jgi:acetyl esterase/lipase
MRQITSRPACIVILAVVFAVTNLAVAENVGPEPLLLWPEGAPGKQGDEPVDKPELRVYLPQKELATGTGVVICPGGGYAVLATDHEGHQVAKWFNSIGVAGFVLKYRLSPRYRHPAPLQDVQRAIRFARANAEKYGLSAKRIGVMGFSAGGHLASTAATHFEAGKADDPDAVGRVSSKPDFVVLGYPVINLQEAFAHRGSARNLLGETPEPSLLESLSNDKQVNKDSPPAFLFHTGEDTGVPVENSLAYYQACRKHGVPAELHVYQYGPHGVGLAPGDPAASTWKNRLADWMRASGLLADVERTAISGVIRVGGQPLRWGMVTFVPSDTPHKPAAFAMVSNGNFKIAATSGPAIGPSKIEVHDLGAVEARPTLEDMRRLDDGKHACDIKAGENKIIVEIEPKQ